MGYNKWVVVFFSHNQPNQTNIISDIVRVGGRVNSNQFIGIDFLHLGKKRLNQVYK